jgi:hypothetical protein
VVEWEWEGVERKGKSKKKEGFCEK